MKDSDAVPHTVWSLKQIAELKAAIKAAKPGKYKINLQSELRHLEAKYYHHEEL